MTAHRNQDNASPSFPRGLALLSLTGVLLMGYMCLPKRGESDTPNSAADTGAVETHPQAARRERSRLRGERASASREDRWADTFAAIEADVKLKAREKLRTNSAAVISITDTATILNKLQKAGFGMHESTRGLLRRWAEADGCAAAAWAEQLPAGLLRENALSSVAIEWANTDLKSTVEWARQLPDAAEQQTLLLAAANEAVRTDPVEALRIAVESPAGAEGDEIIRRAAMEWASKDAAGAMDWAGTISDESLRHKVQAAEMVAWSDTAPENAAARAVDTLPEGRLLDDTLVSIVQRWAQTAPKAAAAWVERFPDGLLRTAAIENLMSQWRKIDPVTAQQWQPKNL
ncbi:MAG: hypothetical protein ABIS50_19465 [Luteolibacter sp.]|uniref:hypothetical protein n=1 Tax=Luteolibacter sp. TaxID=1962973 RepID=UPI003262EA11